jgi:hypothetical protein
MAVGEAFPTGSEFLLAKSSFPSLKTPTVLSQQELGNPVGKAFANRVGVFTNSSKLLAKHAFPVVHRSGSGRSPWFMNHDNHCACTFAWALATDIVQ